MNIAYADSLNRDSAMECELLRLRPATLEDREFLRAVFISTRIDEFSRSGWGEAEILALLASQFDMQDSYYRRHYPGARFDIVTKANVAVGRLYHHTGADELRIIDIALLPAFRGAGIGSQIMRAMVTQAAKNGLTATLYVETVNPVKAFYQRLGFIETGKNGIYERMCRKAAPFDGEPANIAGL